MRTSLRFLLIALSLSALPVQGDAPQSTEFGFAQDRYAAGERIVVVEPVTGDLLAAGVEVGIDADVGGDLAILGGQLRLSSRV